MRDECVGCRNFTFKNQDDSSPECIYIWKDVDSEYNCVCKTCLVKIMCKANCKIFYNVCGHEYGTLWSKMPKDLTTVTTIKGI